jgi:GNAT superfamily N-acetyltransferase
VLVSEKQDSANLLHRGHRVAQRDLKMPDLLVNLLKLPPVEATEGFIVRRAQPFELSPVRRFVAENFAPTWADEISVGFARQPVSVYIATIDRELVGFAAYECTRRAFFGPTGVLQSARGKGIGKALLLPCLWSLREMGYVYAVIGAAGPVRFYQKTVGAIIIPDSEPGIYTDLLKIKNE